MTYLSNAVLMEKETDPYLLLRLPQGRHDHRQLLGDEGSHGGVGRPVWGGRRWDGLGWARGVHLACVQELVIERREEVDAGLQDKRQLLIISCCEFYLKRW